MSSELDVAVYRYLENKGFKAVATEFAKHAKLNEKKMPPAKANLAEAFNNFIKTASKKDESSDDSESEDEKPVAKTNGKAPAAKAKAESSSESDSDSSEDERPVKPAAAKAVPAKTTPAKKEESSDSDSDSSSEDEKPAAKVTPAAKTAAKPAAKKASSSSESSSEESSSEDEKPAAKKQATPASKVATKKAESSSESESDSESEEEQPAKKAKVAPAAANNKRKQESSSESSSRSDSESEEEAPVAKPANKKMKVETNGSASEGEGNASGEFKIYVKGLPWKASEQEVRSFFQACGGITSVEIPVGEDGRSSGTAYVRFNNRKSVDAALALDEQIWPGTERWLKIQEGFDKAERRTSGPTGVRPEGCDTIFVGNLPWDVEEQHLRDLFGECGEIASVRFATSQDDGSFKGFGHVQFVDGDSTDAAVKLAGSDINGRAIRVDYAPPRNRDSLGGGGGGRGRGSGNTPRGGGRVGGRGGRGEGGRGGRGGTPTSANKNKGAIVAASGKKMTFDE